MPGFGVLGPSSTSRRRTDLDFSKHIQKAEEAARRRNYDFAVQLFQQLLEIDPDQAEARAGLRRVLKKRAEVKKTGRLLRTLSGAGPLAMAKTLSKTGKHKAAAKALEGYLEHNPLDVDANLLLGVSLESAECFNSARVVYEFIAEIAPRNPEGLKRAGAMMRRSGEFARALEYYERALEADPRDQDALKARKDLAAEAALHKRDAKPVAHSREQIVDKDLAVELERTRRMHRSEDELREELAKLEDRFAEEPSDVDLMVRMSGVHDQLKDPEAALELARRALSYRKGAPELEELVSRLEAKSLKKALAQAGKAGDRARADELERQIWALEAEDLRRRIRLHPADASLRLELGRLLARSGDPDGALGELQKAVADPRLERDARIALGSCFQLKGFHDLARQEYEKALVGVSDADERSKEILYNLGSIAESEGDQAAARAHYSRVYGVDIGYRDVAEKMERLK